MEMPREVIPLPNIKPWQVLLCRDGQEYKRTVPISGSINPFGQIRILPLIAVSHIGPPSYFRDVRSAAINGQLSTPWTIINHDSRNTRSVNRRFCISKFCRKLFPSPGLCIVSREKRDYFFSRSWSRLDEFTHYIILVLIKTDNFV